MLIIPVLFGARSAQACDEPECDTTTRWTEIQAHTTQMSSDGVVLFEAVRGQRISDYNGELSLAGLAAEASVDGQPVDGSLELDFETGWRGLVWRPDAPLSPGSTLSISILVDNEAIEVPYGPYAWNCGDDNFVAGPFMVEVSAESRPGLELVSALARHDEPEQSQILDHDGADTLVCCDGAYPSFEGCFDTLVWWEGECVSHRVHGHADFSWGINLDELPPLLAQNLSWQLDTGGERMHPVEVGTGELTLESDAPVCGRVIVRDRASGEQLELDELCVGEDIVDSLGLLDVDPSAQLDMVCEGVPYVCESDHGDWDPEACQVWAPTEDPDEDSNENSDEDPGADLDAGAGAGCQLTAPTDSPAVPGLLLALFALVGLLPHRR